MNHYHLPSSKRRRAGGTARIFALAAGPLALAGQAAALTFVDATFANTTLADGTALELRTQAEILADSPPQWVSRQPQGSSQAETANGHWHIRQPFGNGAEVFSSAAGTSPFSNTAPTLRTTMGGLTPGETYEVSVYFWVAGNGAPVGNQEWDIRAGLEAANLTAIRHNTPGALRLDTSGVVFSGSVVVTEADRRLFRYVLGTAVAGGDGTIPVFVSPLSGNDDRTWFDGVGFASLAPPPPATWTGDGAQPLWSVGGNWLAGQAPAAGETLLFGAATVAEAQNDLAGDTEFGGLRFAADAPPFELSGNRFTLSGPLVNQSIYTAYIRNGLLLNGTLDCNLISGGLALEGVLAGAGGLVKAGAGTLEISAANTYSGVTTVQSGPVVVMGDQSAATGGWLIGPGTAAATSVTWSAESVVAVAGTGLIRIGDNKGSLASTLAAQQLSAAGSVTNDGPLYIGLQGYLDLTGQAVWQQNGPLTVEGFTGWNAALGVSGASTFVYAGTDPVSLRSGGFQISRGRIVIQGGTFVTGQPIATHSFESLPGLVSLSGDGILRLTAGLEDLTPGTELVLGGGNGVVDTQTHSVTISNPVSGGGALVKEGGGTLTLAAANTYTGDTVVRAGVLALRQPSLSGMAWVDLHAGAKLKLDFEGADAVGGLVLDGVVQGAGTYSHTSHPEFFAQGAGALVVPAASFAEWTALQGLSGAPDADFDHDSLPDAVEYVLGSDPKSPGAFGVQVSHEKGNVVFVFARNDTAETPDVALEVEVGDDLMSWPLVLRVGADTATSAPGVTVTENGEAADTITVTVPQDGAARKFLRLKVETGL